MTVNATVLRHNDADKLLIEVDDRTAQTLRTWLSELAQRVANAHGDDYAASLRPEASTRHMQVEYPTVLYTEEGMRRAERLRADEHIAARVAPDVHVDVSGKAVEAAWRVVDAQAVATLSDGSN